MGKCTLYRPAHSTQGWSRAEGRASGELSELSVLCCGVGKRFSLIDLSLSLNPSMAWAWHDIEGISCPLPPLYAPSARQGEGSIKTCIRSFLFLDTGTQSDVLLAQVIALVTTYV